MLQGTFNKIQTKHLKASAGTSRTSNNQIDKIYFVGRPRVKELWLYPHKIYML